MITPNLSNKALMAVALVPNAIFLAAVVICVLTGVSIPGGAGTVAGGGTLMTILSVGLANLLRQRRDGIRRMNCR